MPKIFYIVIFLFSLMIIQGCKKETNPVVPPSEHFEPHGWLITDDASQPLLLIWEAVIQNIWNNEHINDTLFVVQGSQSVHFVIKFLDEDSTTIDPPDDADYSFGYNLQDTSLAFILPDSEGKWGFHIEGKSPGLTSVELQVLHLGHVDIRTPFIPLRVTEE